MSTKYRESIISFKTICKTYWVTKAELKYIAEVGSLGLPKILANRGTYYDRETVEKFFKEKYRTNL